jgi:hypothetical protein
MNSGQTRPSTIKKSSAVNYVYVTPEKRTKAVNYSPEKKKPRASEELESIETSTIIS